MLAPQKDVRLMGLGSGNALADQLPARGQVGGRAAQLEVIDVDYQEEQQSGVPKARTPLGDRDEAHTLEVCLAVRLPIAT